MSSISRIIRPVRRARHYSRILFQSLASPVLVYIAISGNAALFLCITIFYHLEKGINPAVHTWFDAFWWGMATVTTVGYGDIVPVTHAGRVVAIVLMLTGLIMFIGFSAILVSLFINRTEDEIRATKAVTVAEYESVMAKVEEISRRLARIESFLAGSPKKPD